MIIHAFRRSFAPPPRVVGNNSASLVMLNDIAVVGFKIICRIHRVIFWLKSIVIALFKVFNESQSLRPIIDIAGVTQNFHRKLTFAVAQHMKLSTEPADIVSIGIMLHSPIWIGSIIYNLRFRNRSLIRRKLGGINRYIAAVDNSKCFCLQHNIFE